MGSAIDGRHSSGSGESPKAQLGFGCAELFAGHASQKSHELVDAAIEAGITYFDTARLYGHGQAERILGQLSPSKRQKLTIATKVGIFPIEMTLTWRLRVKTANVVRRIPGPLTRLVPPPSPLRPRFNAFSVDDLTRSVETSLRAMKIDRVDRLLLHECTPEVAQRPEVLDFLNGLKQQGKIRSFGTATGADATIEIAQTAGDSFDCYQFAGGFGSSTLREVRAVSNKVLVTHSHLSSARDRLPKGVRLGDLAGVEGAEDVTIAEAFVALALAKNANGLVLVSSSRPERFARLARLREIKAEALSNLQTKLVGLMNGDQPGQ